MKTTDQRKELETNAENRRFYSVAEGARVLGLSEMTLYRAISEGQFPAVRIRGRLIIPTRVIDEMITSAVDSGVVVDAARWVTGTTGVA